MTTFSIMILCLISILFIIIFIYAISTSKRKWKEKLERIEKNYNSIHSDFLGATRDFYINKGPHYFDGISKQSANVYKATLFFSSNTPVHYFWIFGNRTEEGYHGIGEPSSIPYLYEKSEVCVAIVIVSEEFVIQELMLKYLKQGYVVQHDLERTCMFYNGHLKTCLYAYEKIIRIRYKNWKDYESSIYFSGL